MGRQSVGKFDHSFISSSQMGKLKRITQLMHKLLISSTLLLLLMWTWDLSKPNFPIFFPCSDLRIDCIYHSNNLPLSFSNSYNLQKAGAGCDKNHWNPPNRFFFFKANPFRCSLTLKIISHRERLKMLSFFFHPHCPGWYNGKYPSHQQASWLFMCWAPNTQINLVNWVLYCITCYYLSRFTHKWHFSQQAWSLSAHQKGALRNYPFV